MSDAVFDFIVVGAGTAGCLMANRLSADPGKRVLLLEAGGRDDYHWVHVPVGYLYCIDNPRTDWRYRTEPAAGLNGRSLLYPRGKVLGGCSSINGMIYMRGQSRDYEAWAQLTGDDAWRWESCLADFKAHEDHHRLDAPKGRAKEGASGDASRAAARPHHGSGGEWRVEKQRLRWDVLDAFSQAAVQAGIPATDDFNRGDNEGVGYFEVNQRQGWRWNAAKAFVRPTCYGRPNFEMWTGAQATRLLIERRAHAHGALRCSGVEVWNGQSRQTARLAPGGQLVLSSGSIGSPQLLQLSGLGPAALLREHGIDVLADLPGVGANLQDHLQIRSVYTVQGSITLNRLAATPWGKARIGLEYLLRRTGPMSMAPSQLGAFTRSSPERPWPNIQFHVQPLSLDAFGQPLHRFDAITASVCNLNPTSRGTVQIRSPRFEDAPAIAPNYLATEEDRRVAAESLRVTRRIMAQPAMAPFSPQEFKPGVQYQSDDELARLAGDIATTIFHPVGTTRMGRDGDPDAVLTPHLQLRDGAGGVVQGLHVVDAGAMPSITSGNTNSPTLMMAEKAARWVAAAA